MVETMGYVIISGRELFSISYTQYPMPYLLPLLPMIKRNIPNYITLLNLTCGVLGILSLKFPDHYTRMTGLSNNDWAVYLMFAAAFFDFCDGFVARALKVDSPLGKQLDSLADVVTFGVLPGMLAYIAINDALNSYHFLPIIFHLPNNTSQFDWVSVLFCIPALLIPLLSAWRLAKFNIDTRQSNSFIGLPTPANGLFIASAYYVLENYNFILHTVFHPAVISGVALLFAILLVSPLPLFAMKFKGGGWKENKVQFIFLNIAVVMLILAVIFNKLMAAVPILVILYILISIINNIATRKTNEV